MSEQHHIRQEFAVHMLNADGVGRATAIAVTLTECLDALEGIILTKPAGADSKIGAREVAVMRTKLEEAAFFAKRAMAMQPWNQQGYEAPAPKKGE